MSKIVLKSKFINEGETDVALAAAGILTFTKWNFIISDIALYGT